MGGSFSNTPSLRRVPYTELDPGTKQAVDNKMTEVVRSYYLTASDIGYTFTACPQCVSSNGIKVTHIPLSAWRAAVGRVTNRPYILRETVDDYDATLSITFIHNLHTVITPPTSHTPPTLILARAAVAQAMAHGDICAISHEPLAELTEFKVGGCGHVFGADASRYDKCPLCTMPVAWRSVTRADLGLTDAL